MKRLVILVLILSFYAYASAAQLINGAGATFPYPLYSKWFNEYNKQKPNVQINYQSIGSGGGIRQLIDQTMDFGASDAPMSEEELSMAKSPVLHIPTVLGAVVLSYNLPGITKLNLTGALISDIFMGKITKWNDSKLQATNKEVKLPDIYISVMYRSDGSGTTAIFTDYLVKISPEWSKRVGSGKSVKWPTGLGGKGNEGVSGLIKQAPGSIGYVELIYAKQNHFSYVNIQNNAGTFVAPSLDTVTAAAQGTLQAMPEDFRMSITNGDGKNAYPISAFTYILVYKNMGKDIGKPLVEFLNWSMGPGQELAKNLGYAPLPGNLIKKVRGALTQIKFN